MMMMTDDDDDDNGDDHHDDDVDDVGVSGQRSTAMNLAKIMTLKR